MSTEVGQIIVACHAWYGDTAGGSFRLASEFAEYLANCGHQVAYVCCAKSVDQVFSARDMINGVEVVRYRPAKEALSGLGRLRFHFSQCRELVRQLATNHRVVALSGHSPLQALGAASALKHQRPYINYTVHSPFDDELMSNATGAGRRAGLRLAALAARWIDRRNSKTADRVQTDSNYTMKSMIAKHGTCVKNKGIVAPGWVDATRFRPASDRNAVRQSLGTDWAGDNPVLFTLRRLENRMGLDTLVDACKLVAQRGLAFRMLIGGTGSLKDQLQQRIDSHGLQDHVRLLGKLPESQIVDCYAAADCFVLPTRALECFGLIVLEAFACNTPVIASSAAAIPELAEQQGSEWMFEPGNEQQLAERICDFLQKRLCRKVDLRLIALEYDKPKVLELWRSLLLAPSKA